MERAPNRKTHHQLMGIAMQGGTAVRHRLRRRWSWSCFLGRSSCRCEKKLAARPVGAELSECCPIAGPLAAGALCGSKCGNKERYGPILA